MIELTITLQGIAICVLGICSIIGSRTARRLHKRIEQLEQDYNRGAGRFLG